MSTLKVTTSLLSRNPSSIRPCRIDQQYLRQFQKNAAILKRQAQEIIRAIRESDCEPGSLDPSLVLDGAGGPFGIAGIVEWCEAEDRRESDNPAVTPSVLVQ